MVDVWPGLRVPEDGVRASQVALWEVDQERVVLPVFSRV
ncbi:MAG: hypothetical protein RI897_3564 [Verrucomicrobiota bacterium]